MSRVIVVGASVGIGAALVRRLAADGDSVVALARREGALADLVAEGAGRVHAVAHDVTQTASVAAALQEAVAWLGGLDVLVYNAGVMPPVAPDEYDTAKDREIIEVNVIGAMAWLNEGARLMAAQGCGTLVGVGSVAGDRGRMGYPAYGASKAALHSFLESLRNRLDRLGVVVITVKPGPVRTAMMNNREKMPLLIEADDAAAQIAAAIRSGRRVVYVPWMWGPIMAVIRSIPSALFRRMSL